jgi:hypothetical protein
MKADNGSNSSNTTNTTTKSYPAPIYTASLDSAQTVTLYLGTGIAVLNQHFAIDVNSPVSWVMTNDCQNLPSGSCSPNPYDIKDIRSTGYYSPATAVNQTSMGQSYETIMGTQGAEVINFNVNISTLPL